VTKWVGQLVIERKKFAFNFLGGVLTVALKWRSFRHLLP
jgi:hypothetical protein